MSMISREQPKEYKDGRTKQSFKDETDINKILARAEKAGTISHLKKFETHYGDFAEFDFATQINKLTQGREIFDALPAEIRSEFRQSPAEFFNYVNDPVNKDRLEVLLPALAAPGRQMIKTKPPIADEIDPPVVEEIKPEDAAATTEKMAPGDSQDA